MLSNETRGSTKLYYLLYLSAPVQYNCHASRCQVQLKVQRKATVYTNEKGHRFRWPFRIKFIGKKLVHVARCNLYPVGTIP